MHELVDLSAKLVPEEKAGHARIEVLDRDPEGRIYYRYWDRIRISAHLMDCRREMAKLPAGKP